MKDKINKIKQFVVDHKYETAAVVGFTAGFVVTRMVMNASFNSVWEENFQPDDLILTVGAEQYDQLTAGEAIGFITDDGPLALVNIMTVTPESMKSVGKGVKKLQAIVAEAEKAA